MPLYSKKEVLNLKLKSIPSLHLKILAKNLNISNAGTSSKIIASILNSNPDETKIDQFIKQKYNEKVQKRKQIISDNDLKRELLNVKSFNWGVVQGQLDQKIQIEFVRKFVRYNDLINEVTSKLHNEVTNYVICTWFNHWTTVLIEEHISQHPKVIPTIKNIKGIDIFFDGQPFDLKITYLPKGYNPLNAINTPIDLAKWMYENQGEQRFGADNRLFVVLFDQNNPEKSWELKRNFDLVFNAIDAFLGKESVSPNDEIVFNYRNKTYTALTKVLLITN
ncbi:MAG: hypothetical protein NUV92_09005 [Ignavibacteria bacterium]|jgi:hypothetical protein|nr:hypothetical protein [Ignavibacteria bacterium]MDH7527923.1 hypothetical protein [Ignavibacteria bacterium]NPV11824.1 hypothetical protein [Ignavibacteria bacterium]